MKKREQAAKDFCEAIKTISAKPENLDNLELYLSIHFDSWIAKYANTPDGLAAEMKEFANMSI